MTTYTVAPSAQTMTAASTRHGSWNTTRNIARSELQTQRVGSMNGQRRTKEERKTQNYYSKRDSDMEAFELYMPPAKPQYNRRTGQFLKGHEPHNKGKSWDEWMSKRGRRRSAKGWKNLEKHRPTERPDTAGRCRKKIVVVTDDGKFKIFAYSEEALVWLGGGNRENIQRCARCNASRKECKHNWRPGQPKGADRINTDYKYMGYRWYFYDDPVWWDKIPN